MYVKFDGTSSISMGLSLLKFEVGEAKAKTAKITVPCADGDLDVTTAVSSTIRYNNRTIKCVFEILATKPSWVSTMEALQAAVNGKKVQLVFSDDPDFHWTGRATVGALQPHGATAGVTVTLDAEPYKVNGQGVRRL